MIDVLNFLWALPAPLCKSFFAFHHMGVPARFPWKASDITRALLLLRVIDRTPEQRRAEFLSELREANALADQAGSDAILNACQPDHPLIATLEAMPGFAERALWTQWTNWPVLDHALAIRLVDEHALTHRSQRIVVPGNPRLAEKADHYDAFADEVSFHFREQERVDEQVFMAVARRYRDGAIQFVLYVDRPTDSLDIVPSDGTHPTCVRPSMRLAVVYYEGTGMLETIVSSGQSYHPLLREAFVRYLLKARVESGRSMSTASYLARRDKLTHDPTASPPLHDAWQMPALPTSRPTKVEIAIDGRWLRVNGRELRLKGKQRDFALVMAEAYGRGMRSPTLEWVLRKAGYGAGTTQLRHVSKIPEFFDFFGYGDGEVWIRADDDNESDLHAESA